MQKGDRMRNMGKHRKKSKYDKAVDKARVFYNRWREAETICPAFDGQRILVTRIGWDHLISSRFRTKVEKMERLMALPLARKLIEKTNTYQEYRYKNGLHYFALVANMDGTKIKVILSSKTKGGEKNFLSVMIIR